MTNTNPLYAPKDIPGKGKGLVATTKIPKGTRVLAETPLFKIPQHATESIENERCVVAALSKLSEDQRQAFFSLCNSYTDLKQEVGIAETNAFGLGEDISTCAVFLDASRMNHSCVPNVLYRWNINTQKMTVHATKDIEEDAEITINYLATWELYAVRQDKLKSAFGFDCDCSLCTLPVGQRNLSDRRRVEIKKLEESLGDGSDDLTKSSPLKALHNVRKLLHLIKKEDIVDRLLPRCYFNSFQIAIAHQDLARAMVFAQRSLEIEIMLEGSDSPKAEQLQSLVDDVEQYHFDVSSSRWKSTATDVPKGLDKPDFENWLWRCEECLDIQPTGLRSDAAFPAFNDLPWDDDLSLDYYRPRRGDIYEPRKHWAFVGEIVEIEAVFRVRFIVKDKSGHELPVSFYTDLRGREIPPSVLRVGCTVVVLYGTKHSFLDGSVGIRHEDREVLDIFPVSLDNLLLLSDKVNIYATVTKTMRTCHGCDKRSASLMKCSKCGFFWYCNKDCQTRGWVENGHKTDCKLLRNDNLKGLFLLKWDKFNNHIAFPLQVEG
ncbi:hypothetical protein ACHAPI_001246 [Fusarium lateritium]